MSAQPFRQLVAGVYPSIESHRLSMTKEDWDIMFASSMVRRKAWAFSLEEPGVGPFDEDALIMIDLTIESASS